MMLLIMKKISRNGLREMSDYNSIIVDTNILLNSATSKRAPPYEHSRKILESISDEQFLGIIPTVVLTEIFYKIAEVKGKDDAESFIISIITLNNMQVKWIKEDNSMFAGEIYFDYNYINVRSGFIQKEQEDRLSAVDCLIISVAKDFPNSVVCTYDEKMLMVTEIDVKKPEEILN